MNKCSLLILGLVCLSSYAVNGVSVSVSDKLVKSICSKIPKDKDFEEFVDFNEWTDCEDYNDDDCSSYENDEEQEDELEKCLSCKIKDNYDLSILTKDINCFKVECASADQKAGVAKCLERMRYSYQNLFQFTPPDFEKQLSQLCRCGHHQSSLKSTPDGDVDHCEFRHMHNCDSKHGKFCLNVDAIMDELDCCSFSGEAQSECFEKARERIEFGRIQMYCDDGLSSMLKIEKVENLKCQQTVDYKEGLIASCVSKCLYKTRKFEDPNYYYLDYYMDDSWFENTCGLFEGQDINGNAFDFYKETVFYKGQKSAWNQVLDVCMGYRSNGELDINTLKHSPYPRELLPQSDFESALDKCCQPNYDFAEWVDDNESLLGKVETDCLKDENVLLDFGFTSGVLRSFLRTRTGNCWEFEPVRGTCDIYAANNAEPCEDEPEDMLLADKLNPENMFWFLKYVEDPVARAWALRGCERGARLGKTQSAFIGLAVGLEAQSIAQSTDQSRKVPYGYKTLYFNAFHTCGVMSAMDANGYYADDATCNPNVLDPRHVDKSCNFPAP